MTPIQMARQRWEAEPRIMEFGEMIWHHLEFGVVISDPEVFLCARPVERYASLEEISDPCRVFGNADTWFLYACAGKTTLARFLKCEPYPLPFFGWEKRNRLRFHTRETLIEYL